jgi:hypothetical protein
MSRTGKWIGDTWFNTVEDAKRIADWLATQGVNVMQTEEEREARLAEEEAAAKLEKESQFDIDRMASDENLAMERIYSQAGTRGVEEPYRVAAARAAKDLRDDEKEMDLMEQAYLLSLMESMRGEDIGQAPAVVAGGGQRQWPSMMGQFRPWEQQKPYWWIT